MKKNYNVSWIPWQGTDYFKESLKLFNQKTQASKLIGSLIFLLTLGLSFSANAQTYCAVSVTYENSDHSSAFSTTGATENVTYVASGNPAGSYSDQTAQAFTSFATQQINFSHTYVGGAQGLRIWIDWNNDFDFNDVGEEMLSQTASGASMTGSFTIPAAASAGNYRMRVRSRYNSVPAPCGNESWGTTIDFTLTIASLFDSPILTQAAGTPSCLSGTTISATGTPDVGIDWYWQDSSTGTSTANPYTGPRTISTNGTYYIRANDAAISYWADATSIVVSNFPLAPAPPAPVADVNPSCAPAGTILTVLAPTAGLEYYWQGTNMEGTSNALNASTPYNATSTGTYYVAAYETATQCWSSTVGLPVTVGTVIPSNPLITQTDYNFCVGETSIEIEALTTLPSGSLSTTLATNNGCTSGAMFDIVANALPVTINAFDLITGIGSVQNLKLYYKVGTNVGSESNAAAWTLHGVFPFTGVPNSPTNVSVTELTVPAGATYGIYLEYDARYTDMPTTTFSNTDLSIISGSGHCSPFAPINGRAFSGTVHYSSGVSGDLEWYSALTGNNNIGSGSPFETVGSSVLPDASVAGSYDFYASSYLDGCYSTSRELITVYLGNVDAVLAPIAVSCNNGNDGAIIESSVICGTGPFTYSIDGGAFGPQTGLTPGTYTVKLKDVNGDESGNYTIVIPDAPAPSAVTMTALTANDANISWTATGSETSWNIEWGVPGFTPGTGTEIGSGTSGVTNYLVTPLTPITYYDVYVSADCGAGTTAGDWALISFVTECAPITALPWTENFDNLPSLGTVFPFCWVDENPGDWQTTNATASNNTAGPLSGANYLRINWSSDAAIWTPEFDLVAGETYEFSFHWAADSYTSWDGAVYVNGSQSFTGATMLGTKFVENGDATSTTYRPEIFCFTPTVSGVHAFGVKVVETTSSPWYMSFDNFKLKQVVTVPGIDGSLTVCQTGALVDLNDVITTTATDGLWNFDLNPNAVNGAGMFNAASVPAGVHDFLYITAGCAPDTTVATITIVKASKAGNDGSIAVCRNQPFNLLSGLSGNADFGGVWTDPNAVVVPNGNATSSNIPGQYNYKYIVTNGVCPADTAKVVVNVQGCDHLGIEDEVFEGFNMYPNPTSDVVIISNTGSTEVFNYEVLDMNGRVILKADKAINGSTTTELNLDRVETGVYLIRVFNEQAEKTFRVVKN